MKKMFLIGLVCLMMGCANAPQIISDLTEPQAAVAEEVIPASVGSIKIVTRAVDANGRLHKAQRSLSLNIPEGVHDFTQWDEGMWLYEEDYVCFVQYPLAEGVPIGGYNGSYCLTMWHEDGKYTPIILQEAVPMTSEYNQRFWLYDENGMPELVPWPDAKAVLDHYMKKERALEEAEEGTES